MSLLAELFTPTIPGRVQAVAVASSVVLLGAVVHFIRRGQLKAGYSIIWFAIGLALVVLSLATRLLDAFALLVGIHYSPAALVLVLGGGLFVLALHYSVMVTKHDRRIRELAQEHALLKAQLRIDQKIPTTGVSVTQSSAMPVKEKVL